MEKIVPDPPLTTYDTSSGSFKNHAAFKRALDHYLNPAPPPAPEVPTPFIVSTDISFEDALAHASSMLQCASVTAQEAGNHLDGTSRALVISVQHLVDMARMMVDRSLDCLQPR
ncbi:DUF3077 domain-containing protein [Pseudomonas sp. CCM 7891]|uniref:DUF3077 domain-containing protein n=1 Tax=Pseudomonas karstica TaxID=1055468 RepID=A0A7X2RS08_9PSED|nr:DUF3077 domain-containing protein [Pseudomonas karstica]MTD18880.1 DUF3077 domain-containing protein [Pseudomonas karstica]